MKARPAPPDLTTSCMPVPKLCARLPSMPNIVQPARKLVNVSVRETIRASLKKAMFISRRREIFAVPVNVVVEIVVRGVHDN